MDFLREFSSNGLYTRHAADSYPEDRFFSMHIHEECEIFYFVSGNAEYLVEGTRYPLEAGSILIMRPAESHRTKILGSDKYERYVINFSVSAIESTDPERQLLEPFFDRPLGRGNLYLPTEFGDENIQKIFMEMCKKGSDYETQINIKTHLFWILDRINRAWQKRKAEDYAPPQNISERIVSYVNSHLFEDISIPVLAEHFFLSSSQFSRIFKSSTGASPWEYITIKRLTAARERIRCGKSAGSAAESTGFKDYSSFYRAYVKHFGSPPKDDMITF